MLKELQELFLRLKASSTAKEISHHLNQMFNFVYKEYCQRITGFVADRIRGQEEVVEDIVAMTFINFSKRLAKHEFDQDNLETHIHRFLYNTAHGKVKNFYRDQKSKKTRPVSHLAGHTESGEVNVEVLSKESNPVQDFIRDSTSLDWTQKFDYAFSKMNERYAKLLRLYIKYDGLPPEEEIRIFMEENGIETRKRFIELYYTARTDLRKRIPELDEYLQKREEQARVKRRRKSHE